MTSGVTKREGWRLEPRGYDHVKLDPYMVSIVTLITSVEKALSVEERTRGCTEVPPPLHKVTLVKLLMTVSVISLSDKWVWL